MARYSKVKIAQLLTSCDDRTLTNAARGAKLEELVRYLFTKVPHVSFYESNVLDGLRAHELDVIFTNDIRQSDLHFLGFTIITECKNTADRVSSAQTGWFVRKLQDRAVNVGILIALSGITGEADGDNSAYSEIRFAAIRDKINILVIKREDIISFSNTSDLVALLKRKILRLTVNRTVDE